MMTQADAELVEIEAVEAGLGKDVAHRIAMRALCRSNNGAWGLLTYWNPGASEHSVANAMPRHDTPDGWRFTTRDGWELFVKLDDISEFVRPEFAR